MKTRILFIVFLVLTTILYSQTTEKKSPSPEMIKVEGGTFTMGATPEQGGEAQINEEPAHKVAVSSFLIGKSELTTGEFKEFIDATGYQTSADVFNGSVVWFGGKDIGIVEGVNWNFDTKGNKRPLTELKYPLIHVSWYDAIEYCNWLSNREGLTQCYTINKQEKDPNNGCEDDTQKWIVNCNFQANGYRLPTEAEWEYAARGGSMSKGYKYSGSNDLKDVGWFGAYSNKGNRTSEEGTSEVCNLKPNELGIYDMSGNVLEWVWDWYGEEYYKTSENNNPKGEPVGSYRGLRGGSWCDNSEFCRVAFRSFMGVPSNRGSDSGFRLVRKID